MPSLNTAADIAAFSQTIYEDALMIVRENMLAVNLVRVYNDRTGTAARSNSEYGTATIGSIGETDDLTSQAFTPSVLSTLTPAEAGAQFFITDLRVETDPNSVRSDASQELGVATAEKIDVDLFSNFTSFTGGTVGTAGSAASWNYFFQMMTYLRIQKAPMPWSFVCSPAQWLQMGKEASIASTLRTNAPESMLAAVARNFFVGNMSGVDIYVSSNVPTSSTNAYAGMFSRDALAYDNRRAPRLEPERDASRRGIELNMTTVFAHGVWRPKYGVQAIFDNQVS